jgi:hypothetical protein
MVLTEIKDTLMLLCYWMFLVRWEVALIVKVKDAESN